MHDTDRRQARARRAVDRGIDPLPDARTDAETFVFTESSLRQLRRMVQRWATAAGFNDVRAGDIVFVANEIATNSIRHAGGRGVFKIWTEDGDIVCESRDGGHFPDAVVGRERPALSESGGLGLWLATEMCDLVQIRSLENGSVVRVRMSRAG